MTGRSPSLERRLLRSHLGVAALGAAMLLIALAATAWLRSNNLRLAALRGPTVRATMLALGGVHRSSEALYGWIVARDPAFRQARERSWSEQIDPAAQALKRLGTAWSDAASREQLERLEPVLTALHTWHWWIEDLAASEGAVPAKRLLTGRGRRLVEEAAKLARSVTTLASGGDGAAGQELGSAAIALDGSLRLAYAHLEELSSPGENPSEGDVHADLESARIALGVLAGAATSLSPEAAVLAKRLERVFASFDRVAAHTIEARRSPDWNLAQHLLASEAIPTAALATNLLTAISVKQEELMLADAARVEWFSDATVIAGVVLLLVLVLTAVLASRRHAARLTRPIAELSHATARLAGGDFALELPVRGDDELARLARAFNAMQDALRNRSEALQKSRVQLRARNRRLEHEVAERRRAERDLARRSAELEHANRSLAGRNADLDEFTFVASHDLQEPLRKLLSFSKLLKADLGGGVPAAARDLECIMKSAERMRALVQDLLALSRTGRGATEARPIALRECVDAAIEQLEVQITESDAEIVCEDLPTATVDRTLVTQLFQNLIGNAIKFHAPGKRPVVEITCEENGGTWVFGVRDEGIGIEPEYAEQIFTPFKRLHGRDAYEGTGIGLAICRKAVARHDGRIWVETRPGEGAHFRFTLGDETRTDECRPAA